MRKRDVFRLFLASPLLRASRGGPGFDMGGFMTPPDDPYYWLPSADDLREQITKAERLAAALRQMARCFLTNDQVTEASVALRDFLCVELEQRLRDFREPTAEDLY